MAAVCAICDLPLIPGQKFRLEGSEVMHPHCVRTGRPTAMRRLVVDHANDLRVQQRAMSQLGERLNDVESRATRVLLENREHERTIRDLRSQLAIARRERDAARSEAALHQTIAAAPAPTVAAPATHEVPSMAEVADPPRDRRDDTEIRFSLLELDPT